MVRKQVVAALRPLDAQSVENGVGIGCPDVNYADGWIELKHLDAWPARNDTPVAVPHFTPQQRVWHLRRTRAGGASYVLLKAGDDWALMRGDWAAEHLGRVTKDVIIGMSVRTYYGALDAENLVACLRC